MPFVFEQPNLDNEGESHLWGSVSATAIGKAGGRLARPALAGLLVLIGVRTVKPAVLQSIRRAGAVHKAVLVVTFP